MNKLWRLVIDVEGIEAFVKNIISEQSLDSQKRNESKKEEENDDFESDKNSCPAFFV